MNSHIRVSARGIVIHDGKILLNEFGGGEYCNIPGGGVEPGETAKEAVVREVMEESGLKVEVEELVFVLEYEPSKCDFLYGKRAAMSLVFRCHLIGDDCIQQPSVPDFNPDNPEITSKAKWVPISELKDTHYLPYIHKELMEYIETGSFSPLFIEEPLEN